MKLLQHCVMKKLSWKKDLQDDTPEQQLVVEVEHIHEIIETQTGIPVGKLQVGEQQIDEKYQDQSCFKSHRTRRSCRKSGQRLFVEAELD